MPGPERLIVRESVDNIIAEWRKRVILPQEVDIRQWQSMYPGN